MPVISFMSVDLPAPFSPHTACTSARRRSMVMFERARHAGEGLVDAFHLEHDVGLRGLTGHVSSVSHSEYRVDRTGMSKRMRGLPDSPSEARIFEIRVYLLNKAIPLVSLG